MIPAEANDPSQTTDGVAAADELPLAARNPNSSPAPPTGAAFPPFDPQATGPYQAAAEDSTPAIAAACKVPIPNVPGYEIVNVLGRGGMGVVYKARHLALKRVVALKMSLGGGHAGEYERQRFRSEAEAVARLQHPNIVHVYEVGEHEDLPYAALEFVEGGTLSQRLKRDPVNARPWHVRALPPR
jgi:serine/threonine protein kinase